MINIGKEEKMLVVIFIAVLMVIGILVIEERNILDVIYFVVMLMGFGRILFDLFRKN